MLELRLVRFNFTDSSGTNNEFFGSGTLSSSGIELTTNETCSSMNPLGDPLAGTFAYTVQGDLLELSPDCGHCGSSAIGFTFQRKH